MFVLFMYMRRNILSTTTLSIQINLWKSNTINRTLPKEIWRVCNVNFSPDPERSFLAEGKFPQFQLLEKFPPIDF
jgi:hypothetical protein